MKTQTGSDKNHSDGAGGKPARTIRNLPDYLSEVVVWLGAAFLIGVTLLTVCDSFGRYFLNSPITGTMEMVQLMMVIIVFSGMVYITAKDANVKVDILVSHFPAPVRRILTYLMTLIGSAAFGCVSWQLWLTAMKGVRINEESAVLDIPVFPFKFAAAVGAALICLFLLRSFIRSLIKRS